MPSNKELGESLLKKLEGKIDAYEVILSKQKYLAGNVRLRFPALFLVACLISATGDHACGLVPPPIRLAPTRVRLQEARRRLKAQCRALVEGYHIALVLADRQGRRARRGAQGMSQ
jgi:hypothetical protein